MAKVGAELSVGVSRVGVRLSILNVRGDPRGSSGMAEIGVGKVEVVMDEYAVEADPGVVTECVAESGVPIPFVFGESSGRPDRAFSLLLLPDLRRLNDSCRFKGDRLDICAGIMRGGRSFGDSGGRVLEEACESLSFVDGLDE